MKLGIHIVLCFRCSHPKDTARSADWASRTCSAYWIAMGHGKALILERGHKMACALWLSHTHSEWSQENSSDAKPVFLISINNSSPSLRSMLNPRKMHLLHLWVVQLSSHGNELAALTSSASSWIHVYVARRKKHWVIHTTLNPMGITSTTLTLDKKPTKR